MALIASKRFLGTDLLHMRQQSPRPGSSGIPPRPTSSPPDPPPDALLVEHLKIDYRLGSAIVHAVDDVSFTIGPREKVMLIGPSGCGKSTILKTVAGFIKPQSGTIRVGGRSDFRPSPDRAVVFQEFDQLFPWKTVLSNVEYPLRLTAHSKEDTRVEALKFLDMVGLSAAIHRFPHQLSGGMKQRVAIARALALGSPMMLMDEPFGALDAITRSKLQNDLKQILDDTAVALLFVTHSIEEALLLGDRIIVLNGTPSTVAEIVSVERISRPRDEGYGETRASLETLLGGGTYGDD